MQGKEIYPGIRKLREEMKNLPKEKGGTGNIFLDKDKKALVTLGARIINVDPEKKPAIRRVNIQSSNLSTDGAYIPPSDYLQLGFFPAKDMFYMPDTNNLNFFEQQIAIHEFAQDIGRLLQFVTVRMPTVNDLVQIARDIDASGLFVDPLGRSIRTKSMNADNTLYLGHGHYDSSGGLEINLLSWEAYRGSDRLYTTPIFIPA